MSNKNILIENDKQAFGIGVVSNHVKNNKQCASCISCELDDARRIHAYFCKKTGDDIDDTYQHYCDEYKKI